MRKHNSLLYILLSVFMLIPTAYAAWYISGLTIEEAINESTIKPVCYINTNEAKNQYYSIETALNKSKSGDTVYVIPKTNPTIKYNCTVPSNVTLTIGGLTKIENNVRKYLFLDSKGNYTYTDTGAYAYKDRGVENESSDSSNENLPENRGPHIQTEGFGDSKPEYYCQNSVTLEAKLTISKGATLNIAGRLGSEGWGLSGATTGDYCEIVFSNNLASIKNSGTIDCCGYIKPKDKNVTLASVTCLDGSKVYMPFVIRDFSGGTYSVSCNPKKGDKVMPFNEWLVCNIQVRQIFRYGSTLQGYYDAYNSQYISKVITIKKGHKVGLVNMIGVNNSIVNVLSKDARITIDTSSDDCSKTIIGANGIINKKMKIRFEGKCEIAKMIIPNPMPALSSLSFLTNVEIADVDSSKFFFSLNHYYDFEIRGTVNVTTSQKVLPGCNVKVANTGVLNINAPAIFVENLDEAANGATKAYKYPTIYNQDVKPDEVRNALINDGTVNVSSNGKLAGKIHSSNIDSTLNLSEASALSISYKEGAYGKMDIPNFHITYQNKDISGNANGPLLSDAGVAVSNLDKKIYIYTSENNNSGWKEATNLDSYSITYHLNGGSADVKDGETKTSYLKQGESKILYSASIADPSKKYYVFAGWYMDAAFTKPLRAGIEVKDGTHLDLYAKYSYEKYKVEYQIENQSGIEATITNPNASFTSFTQKDLTDQGGSFLLQEATSDKPEQIMFDGWYTSPDYSVASKLSGNEINQCQSYMLYARFVKVRPTITIDDSFFDGVTNAFVVEENGKLSSTDITSISQRLSMIRTDSDKPQYATGYKNGDVSIALNELKDYVFKENTTLTITKSDKYCISYVFDANTIENKYYTRTSSGAVEGDPSLSDPTIHDNNDRHFYKLKNGNDSFDNETAKIVSLLNENKDKNDFKLNVWWAYHFTFNVESVGANKPRLTISCLNIDKEYGKGETVEDYIPSGEEIKIVIQNNYWPSDSITKIVSTDGFLDGSNKYKAFGEGEFSKTSKMLEKAVTITVKKG